VEKNNIPIKGISFENPKREKKKFFGDVSWEGNNGKTNFADSRMETDFLPFRKKNPFPSVNPQNPFYPCIRNP
jgi:hypothetical protein